MVMALNCSLESQQRKGTRGSRGLLPDRTLSLTKNIRVEAKVEAELTILMSIKDGGWLLLTLLFHSEFSSSLSSWVLRRRWASVDSSSNCPRAKRFTPTAKSSGNGEASHRHEPSWRARWTLGSRHHSLTADSDGCVPYHVQDLSDEDGQGTTFNVLNERI